MNGIIDDFRQIGIVTRYEFTKYLRGKKILIYLGLMALVIGLMTALPYAFGDKITDGRQYLTTYISFASLLIILGATLFGATAIVSEFEERTALILFTRPIRKESIFIGKFIAAFVLVALSTILYYLVSALIILAITGYSSWDIGASLGVAILYVFATTGVAFLISAFSKKGSTSAIITVVFLLLLVSIVSSVMGLYHTENWFMVDIAANAILDSYPAYVEIAKEAMESMGLTYTPVDVGRAGAALAGWGIITGLASYVVFKLREF